MHLAMAVQGGVAETLVIDASHFNTHLSGFSMDLTQDGQTA